MRFTTLITLACLGLLAVDVGLVLKNRALEERVASLTRAVYAAERPSLIEGQEFPRISASDANGEPISITGSKEHTATLLLVSADACDACESVRPLWRRVAELAAGSHLRVIELVVDVGPEGLQGRDAPYPLIAAGDDVWSLTARMPGVPGAILIDEQGVVQRAFYGKDHDGLAAAVEDVLLFR